MPGFLILFLVFSFTVTAQENEYLIRRIGQDQGLAHNNVFSITSDSKGFLWVVTGNGLQRFDGSRFVTYNDLQHPWGSSIIESAFIYDSPGENDLWISDYKQLGKLDISHQRFTIYKSHDLLQDSSFHFQVFTSDNGERWLLNEKVIIKTDQAGQNIEWIDFNRSPASAHSSNCWITDKINGYSWLRMFARGLVLFDHHNKKVYSLASHPDAHPMLKTFCNLATAKITRSFKDIMLDSKNNFWINSWGNSFYRYNASEKKLHSYTLKTNIAGKNLQTNISAEAMVTNIFEDSRGIIWLTTENAGLQRYNTHEDTFEQINLGAADARAYNYIINSIYQDKAENIWLGTDRGIIQFSPYHKVFSGLRHEAGNESSLPQGEITSVFQSSTGLIFASTWGAGFSVFDSALNFKKTVQLTGNTDYNATWCFAENIDHSIWIGCQHGNLHFYNPVTNKLETTHPPELKNSTVRCMTVLRNGDMLLGLHNGEIATWSRNEKKFIAYSPGSALEFSTGAILNIFEDKQGKCWVSTAKGLRQFDPATGKIITAFPGLDNMNKNAVFANGIEQLNDSTLVIAATHGGIKYFNTRREKFIQTFTGFPANASAFAVKKDADGNTWFTTDYGLYKITSEQTLVEYNIEPGMINSSFHQPRFVALKDSKWATCTTAEIIFFNPSDPELREANRHTVEITGFRIFNNPMNVDSLIATGNPINLNYRQNFITIEFSALDFFKLQKTQFYYKLSGVDADWVPAAAKEFATYTNLSAGKYIFSVRSGGGAAASPVTNISIIIAPPFWLRTWFILLMVLMIVAFIYGSFRWRVNSIRAVSLEKLKVQQLNAERYKDKLELERIVNYFSSSLIGKTTVDDVLWDVARNLIGRLGFEDCMIYLWNADKTKMLQRAGFGPKGSIEEIRKNIFEVSPGEGVVGYVMNTNEQVLIPDTSKDPRYRVDEQVRQSELTVPIIYNSELIGVIDSEHREKNFYTSRHIQVLSTIATLMATKINSIESEQQLQQTKLDILGVKEKLAAAKLDALRSQMNPHFIFNCLNSIDNLIQTNQPDKATTYLARFARLIRLVLDSSKSNLIAFQRDFETMRLYLEMEQFRCNNKFSFELNAAEELLQGDYKVPPLLIQPFIENAIQHGLMNKMGSDRLLNIDIGIQDNCITYKVQDNGIGRLQAEQIKSLNKPEHVSYGIAITNERLRLHNNNIAASVTITDCYEQGKPNGTIIGFSLDIID